MRVFFFQGTDTGDWRPHLAMLLSAPEGHEDLAREALERLGESLLARRLLFAAHLCFLLAASANSAGPSGPPQLPSRIWLLGVPSPQKAEMDEAGGRFVMSVAVERASAEAVQLTEVYEYALALATRDKHFFLPQLLVSIYLSLYGGGRLFVIFSSPINLNLFHLQPFKFAYCLRLIDAGLIEKAFRYLEVLCNSISTLLEAEMEESDISSTDLRGLFPMASQCLRLAEQLRHHPEVDSFDSTSSILGPQQVHHNAGRTDWLDRLRNVYNGVCGLVSHCCNHFWWVISLSI